MRKSLFLKDGADSAGKKAFNGLLVMLCIFVFLGITTRRLGLTLRIERVWEYRTRILHGFGMTVTLSVFSLAASLALGTLAALGLRSRVLFLAYLARAYVEFIRGTPLLVQIYLFYYIVGTAWGIDNRYIAGVMILSIFEGAYISEIIRGGLASIESSQAEIARAIGLTRSQAFRLVVFRQLIIRILPALAGQFASIIKDSSLLSVIALIELTQTTAEISAANYALFENYFILGLLYFALTFPVSLATKWLERKYRYAN
jgi:polar amino acid transport system permease protein